MEALGHGNSLNLLVGFAQNERGRIVRQVKLATQATTVDGVADTSGDLAAVRAVDANLELL